MMACDGLQASDFNDVNLQDTENDDVAADLSRFQFLDDTSHEEITRTPISEALRRKMRWVIL